MVAIVLYKKSDVEMKSKLTKGIILNKITESYDYTYSINYLKTKKLIEGHL